MFYYIVPLTNFLDDFAIVVTRLSSLDDIVRRENYIFIAFINSENRATMKKKTFEIKKS